MNPGPEIAIDAVRRFWRVTFVPPTGDSRSFAGDTYDVDSSPTVAELIRRRELIPANWRVHVVTLIDTENVEFRAPVPLYRLDGDADVAEVCVGSDHRGRSMDRAAMDGTRTCRSTSTCGSPSKRASTRLATRQRLRSPPAW
jgi:hypothetical protein